jgi:hypothetical protein
MTKVAGAKNRMVMLSNSQMIEYNASGMALSHQVTSAYFKTAKGEFDVVSRVRLLKKIGSV